MLRSMLSIGLLMAAVAVITLLGLPLAAIGVVALAAIASLPAFQPVSVPRLHSAFSIGAAAFVFLLMPGFAFAQETAAAVPNTSIELTQIVLAVAGLAATALAAIAHGGVRALVAYLNKRTGIDLDAATRAYLDPAIDKAVAWARLKAEQRAQTAGVKVDIHNETVAGAANYVLNRVPDALRHFKIDDRTLNVMIEARIATMFGVKPGVDYAGAAADLAASNK